ncbi:MAG: hypothetical protein LC725_09545, partial [Lentisphaerae bacterium]|nr:hypothetical protein [Lentisphaerota bacterium]
MPEAYALLVKDPMLTAYKYVNVPHQVRLAASRYHTEPLLDQVADHVAIRTAVSRDGEAVSTATFFVKNASSQYLAVALPEHARLWSTKQVEADRQRVDIPVLRDGNTLLIPVPRPRDLNDPIQIEMTFAGNHAPPSLRNTRMRLEAPAFLKTPAPFVYWTVELPETLAAAGAGGNLAAGRLMQLNGLGAVARTVWRVVGAIIVHAWPGLLAIGFLLAVVGLLVWRTGRWWPAVAVLAPGVILILLVSLSSGGLTRMLARAGVAFDAANGNIQSLSFSRSVTLPADQPLYATIRLAPAWLGSAGSLPVLVAAGLAGLLCCGLARRRGKAAAPALAAGWTLLAVALAQLAHARTGLAFAALVALPVAGGVAWLRWARAMGGRRKKLRAWQDGEDIPPFAPVSPPRAHPVPPPPPVQDPDPGSAGYMPMSILTAAGLLAAGLMFVMLFLLPARVSASSECMASAPDFEARSLEVSIRIPAAGRDRASNAQVVMRMEMAAAAPGSGLVLPADCVLTKFQTDAPRDVSLSAAVAGYILQWHRPGTHAISLEFQAPVVETDGQWQLDLALPANLQNDVQLVLPGPGWDVQSDNAVYFRAWETNSQTEVTALFAPNSPIHFTWRPKIRKAELEATTSFCEVNSLFTFEPGVVDGLHQVRYQVVQGEIKTLSLSIPEPMNVTAVAGPGISTWRFDPAARRLEAILRQPVTGAFVLDLSTQTPCEGLPYASVIHAPEVHDVSRQRGAIALATPDTVQITVDPQEGLNAMNIADVSVDLDGRANQSAGWGIRRAFRYHSLPAVADVRAEQVLPEIRVEEKASLSVAHERIVLVTQLKTTITKAGVFALRLKLPEGYDLESLTGQDVSHWDEVKDPAREIVVHFSKPAIGTRDLNLVLARMEKNLGESLVVPRVGLINAFKHGGSLVVSGERGVRLTTTTREGVSELNPRELGIQQAGVLAFHLLRPQWTIVMNVETLAPAVKPEILHRVDVTDGMIKGRVYIRYRIENAGCKVFEVQAPHIRTPLTFTGADIAKVRVVDSDQGIWEITLHNKVESVYLLEAGYQAPFDPVRGEVDVRPLLPLNTDPPRGYLAVLSDGRVQIKPRSDSEGLKPEEARGIPAVFGAGDLADAVLCYRTILPDYILPLEVVRHVAAESLPANVTQARLASAVSPDGRVLTAMSLQMHVGDMRFLNVALPGPDDRFWSAFVNGKVAAPMRDGAIYRIPLGTLEAGEPATVDFLYA